MYSTKNISKIDAHINLIPDDVIKANSDFDGKFIVNGSVKEYISMMKMYSIEEAFIMPSNDPYMLSMSFTVEAVHDNLLKIASQYPGVLYCFADIDIKKDIHETLREFECLSELYD